jgi:hypothetical protein
MKNNLLFGLILIMALPVRAQKVIEKHIDLAAGGFVDMNFQVSDSIRIITWAKNEVYIKSSINVNDNKDNDAYNMTFDGPGKTVEIRGKLDWNGSRGCRTSSRKDSADNHDECCCCCNVRSEIVHEVYIPENADFSIETINGNIVISGKTGDIRAKTISGYIDLAFAPERQASLNMRTISGTMYSNFDFPAGSRNARRIGGGSLSAELNGGGKRIELETISGDIFFRKQG